jgi:hypothetical protein
MLFSVILRLAAVASTKDLVFGFSQNSEKQKITPENNGVQVAPALHSGAIYDAVFRKGTASAVP